MSEKVKHFLLKYKFDFLFIVLFIIAVFFISNNFATLFIKGYSMYPTLNDNSVLIIKKSKEPKNGEIIVFESSESWGPPSKKFVKRIIASEGDTVEVTSNEVIVNGESKLDTTEKNCIIDGKITLKIGEGNYFVMGDNFSSSNDSLLQLCNGNDDFIVDKENVTLSGKAIQTLGGS